MENLLHSQEDVFSAPTPERKRRFFFDVHDGLRTSVDDIGLELAGVSEAEQQAVSALADITRDTLRKGAGRRFVVEVRGEGGDKILRATLSMSVEVLDGSACKSECGGAKA